MMFYFPADSTIVEIEIEIDTVEKKKPESQKRKRKSPSGNRCVLGKCGMTSKDGFSLYTLPEKPASIKSEWVRFIRGTRGFKFNPSDYVRVCVCSGHFKLDQFEESQLRMYKLGLRKNPPALKERAVPSLKNETFANPFPPEFFDRPGTNSDITPAIAMTTSTAKKRRISTYTHQKTVREIEDEYACKAAEGKSQETHSIQTKEENNTGIQASKQTVREIEDEYARKAAEGKSQETQSIQTKEENNTGTQASKQMVSQQTQAKVRMHPCGVRRHHRIL
ncbi:uncharacterized protein [Amphiura filiformis]|uniref:uncharacterized protein isoform X2 n=1 Tax=Amphiura filiformis TaxID=82378 RepID=UPI003B21C82F